MVAVRCSDGRVLELLPVPVVDRAGSAYEMTLEMQLDGRPFGEVGEHCGWRLQVLARDWAEQGVPQGRVETGVRAWARAQGHDPDGTWTALAAHLPRDCELFCFRARDPDDVGVSGEVRATFQSTHQWGDGVWHTDAGVVLQAWGDDGLGVRARLSFPELRGVVDRLLDEREAAAGRERPARPRGSG